MITDKILPNSMEAEQAVLGSMLLDSTKVNKVTETLDSNCFYLDKHKTIFKVIISLKATDILTVSEELKNTGQLEQVGGVSYLAELINSVPSSENAIAYAQIIKDTSLRRQIINNAASLLESGYKDSLDDLVVKTEFIIDEIKNNHKSVEQQAMQLSDFLNSPIPPIQYYIDNFLQCKGKTMISAQANIGKSFLVQNLALALTTGKISFLDKYSIQPARVLLLDLEMGESALKARLEKMFTQQGLKAPSLFIKYVPGINLLDSTWQKWLESQIKDLKIEALIIDPLSNAWSGDENNKQEVQRLTAYLDSLIYRFKISILLTHHWRKATKENKSGGEMAAGSYKWSAWLDHHITLQGDINSVTVNCEKSRNGQRFKSFLMKLNPETLWFEYTGDFTKKYTEETLASIFVRCDTLGTGKAAVPDLKKFAKEHKNEFCSEGTVKKLIDEIKDTGSHVFEVVSNGRGKTSYLIKKDRVINQSKDSRVKDEDVYIPEETDSKDLYNIIHSEGRIAPHKKGLPGELREEYNESVPVCLRYNAGLKLDEMAAVLARKYPFLEIACESDLLQALDNYKTKKAARNSNIDVSWDNMGRNIPNEASRPEVELVGDLFDDLG